MKNQMIVLNKIWKNYNYIAKPKKEAHQHFFNQLGLLSSGYSSPFDSCFLFEISSLKFLNKSDAWIARDGATPLLWFFYRNPFPKSLKSKLYIESSLEKFIPNAWLKNVGTYQIFSSQKKKPSQIIFTGIASEDFLPKTHLPFFYRDIKKLKITSPRNLPKFSMISYRPFNYNYSSEYFVNYFQGLYEFFGSQIESLDLSQVSAVEDYSDTLIIDINSSHLLSDNALVHFFLNRGARLLKSTRSKKTARKIYISQHHGFSLNDHIQPNEAFTNSLYHDLDKLMKYALSHQSIGKSKSLKNQMPWPQIFNDWVQTISL